MACGRRMSGLAVLAAAGVAGPAVAHPHVFIDTTVTAILDPHGRLTAVRLRWDYDNLLSMMVVADKGADADLDGTISLAEAVVLDGFDMTWIDGFDGDTSVFQGEVPLPLEPGPQDWATGWMADGDGGHLWSEHTRRLAAPVDLGAGPVSIVVHDVSDYTAYALTDAALLPGNAAEPVRTDCRIEAPSRPAEETDGGLVSTVGLFLFGRDDGAETSIVPDTAPGRVIAVLTCG